MAPNVSHGGVAKLYDAYLIDAKCFTWQCCQIIWCLFNWRQMFYLVVMPNMAHLIWANCFTWQCCQIIWCLFNWCQMFHMAVLPNYTSLFHFQSSVKRRNVAKCIDGFQFEQTTHFPNGVVEAIYSKTEPDGFKIVRLVVFLLKIKVKRPSFLLQPKMASFVQEIDFNVIWMLCNTSPFVWFVLTIVNVVCIKSHLPIIWGECKHTFCKWCRHSSVDSFAPSILPPRVQIPSTPSKLFSI